ncbi:hypothetical protein L2E82_37401 [Cichorium intybus]|uniref:Uncharacterized protein n=1 Tax=Cichorium intybus TaxID=13427 RepID=A0ACB9AFE8_CICIN|nr:hypothetical protein L2E82_37401 [Cichorium intybus]
MRGFHYGLRLRKFKTLIEAQARPIRSASIFLLLVFAYLLHQPNPGGYKPSFLLSFLLAIIWDLLPSFCHHLPYLQTVQLSMP